ncbi:MAG TPA: PQQ-dependent sugar dehydrogenase, partial [Chthoniobacterales bacterium]|nr:PQQ-dependent sugar dehydrogenase [Chthoniobacterales bacterium]
MNLRRIAPGLAACLLLAGSSWSRAATLPTGFTEAAFGASMATGCTAMEFAPDGRLFVCQQNGHLRAIKDGALLAADFLSVTVSSSGERGLLGIAFDPNFASNRFVYIYYTATTPTIHNRVSRFTASMANPDVVQAGTELPILDLETLGATNHNGGAIHFGPDGKLYVAVGENANGANAQSLANRLGKILRINADGSIPLDNPTSFPNIAGSTTGLNKAIWAVGLRNPFTFSFQPGTGVMFINDVGENTWEEINQGTAGVNYGWMVHEGVANASGYTDPIYAYNHNGTGAAIAGSAFYNPAILQFPASYVGKYFFGDYIDSFISVLDPSDNTATGFATGASNPVDIHIGPDGALYYLRQGGQVMRVQATPSQALNISTRAQVQT